MAHPFSGSNLPMPDYCDLKKLLSEGRLVGDEATLAIRSQAYMNAILSQVRNDREAVNDALTSPIAYLLARVQTLDDHLNQALKRIAELEKSNP